MSSGRASSPRRPWRGGIDRLGGLLLVGAAVAGLVLASSRSGPWYAALRAWPLELTIDSIRVALTPTMLVNEGAMTLFFLAVGVELRRAIHVGELAGRSHACLPLAAAVGGIVAPASIYAAIAPVGPPAAGGVPMATDTAVALAVPLLLGRRASPAVRTLLLSLALVDDVGALLVVAIVDAGALVVRWLPLVLIGIVLALGMRRDGVRSPILYVLPGATLWFGLHLSGLHPALAGVVMGLLTPVAECERLQARLYPWVALVIVPAFAFLNAGVDFEWPLADPAVATGVALGLLVGKPLGIVAACWIAVRLRLARLSAALGWRELVVVGLLAGVGFTTALFLAEIAFADATRLASAKLGIVAASAMAMLLAAIAGRLLLRPPG